MEHVLIMENPQKDKYGLRNISQIKISYNIETQECIVSGSDSENVEISQVQILNMPKCIYLDGVPYYPSKYQFSTGFCHYHSDHPPLDSVVEVHTDKWDFVQKKYTKNVKLINLEKYDNKRPRTPDAYTVMGESAKYHAQKCINLGKISIKEGYTVTWNWCHLIAFSMLSNENAQIKKNFVCGTSAFNGQMQNVEQAVKRFIRKYKRHLTITVRADVISGTQIVLNLAYGIYDKKAGLNHTEYYHKALSMTYSDIVDEDAIFNTLEKKFVNNPPV